MPTAVAEQTATPSVQNRATAVRSAPRSPALYQFNTRVALTRLSSDLQRAATLDDIPDSALDRVSGMGFDWIWMLSAWQTTPAARAVSLSNEEWRKEFTDTLPDLRDQDIAGSGFAVADHTVIRAWAETRLLRAFGIVCATAA